MAFRTIYEFGGDTKIVVIVKIKIVSDSSRFMAPKKSRAFTWERLEQLWREQ